MNDRRFDVAVIGLGLIGSAVLRNVGIAGASAVGIGPVEPESFATHSGVFASHYDSGRITRHIDLRIEWAELARRAIAEYPEIEAEGEPFHRPVGLVYAQREAAQIQRARAVVSALGDRGVHIAEAASSPDSRIRVADGCVVWKEGAPAGHIDPRRMTRAQLAGAVSRGAQVIRSEALSITSENGGWRVHLADGGTVAAGRLILAAGPHTDEIVGLPGVPELDVRAAPVLTAVLDGTEQARLAGLPSIFVPVQDPVYDDCYAVPPTDYPDGTVRLKLGATQRDPRHLRTAQERRDWMRGNDHEAAGAALRRLAEELLPGLRAVRWETKPCLISDTPTDLPYVDHLAENFVVVSGCNGYAAKSANALGALAARLALEGHWCDEDLPQDRFRLLYQELTRSPRQASSGRHRPGF